MQNLFLLRSAVSLTLLAVSPQNRNSSVGLVELQVSGHPYPFGLIHSYLVVIAKVRPSKHEFETYLGPQFLTNESATSNLELMAAKNVAED